VGTSAERFSYLHTQTERILTSKNKNLTMDVEVSVHDPVYIVRRRLGQRLDQNGSREDSIENMGAVGSEIDNSVAQKIHEDYQREIEDVLSDMDGQPGLGGASPMTGGLGEKEQQEPQSDEKMQKFMRVSSLQLAFEAYPVFKSIVVN
jgi:hypothetical protein